MDHGILFLFCVRQTAESKRIKSTNVCAGWMMQTFVAGGQVVQWLLQQHKGHWFNSPPVYEWNSHKDNFFYLFNLYWHKLCLILNKNTWLYLHSPPDIRIRTVLFRCAWSNMMSSFSSVSSSETMISGSGSGPRALLHISCLLLLRVGGGEGPSFQELPMFLFSLCPGYFQQNYQIVEASWVFPPEIQNDPSLGLFSLSPITIKLSSSIWAHGHCVKNMWLLFHRCLGHYDLNPISSRENKMILTCRNWLCPHSRVWAYNKIT